MKPQAQENSDLLSGQRIEKSIKNTEQNAIAEDTEPPDGGLRAYSVLVASFLTNGLLFGQINSCGVLYSTFEAQLKADGVSNADTRAALVGSLTMGTLFFLSPLSGVLTGLLGLRLTAVLGGCIAAFGLFISSFLTRNVDALMFTYGVLFGLGCSFAYTPSLAILGHYFKKHLGLVNGIVTVGSSVFTVILSPLMSYMIEHHGIEWLFRLLALLTVGLACCGLLFKPRIIVPKPCKRDDSFRNLAKSVLSIEIWRNRKYKIWALCMPICLIGYLVSYVHIKKFTLLLFVDVNSDLPLQCMAITSGLGRLIIGYLADRPEIDRIMLQQISFYLIGLLTIVLAFAKVFWLVIIASLGIGLCDGAFISLIGPIAFMLVGGTLAPQAIGCMLGLAALPITIGPSIAGAIYGATQSYTLPFALSGIASMLGATLMFSVRYKGRGRNRRSNGTVNGYVSTHSLPDAEKAPAALLTSNGNKNAQTTL